MGEVGAVGALAIAVVFVRHNGGDGHGNTNEAVVVDSDPDDVEPGETADGRAPWPPVASAALLEPVERPYPFFDGMQFPEELFLRVEVGRGVLAQQSKEGRNRKGFVAVGNDCKVDGLVVVSQLEEGRGGVDGNHEEDADDAGEVVSAVSRAKIPISVWGGGQGMRTTSAHPVWCSSGRASILDRS